MLEQLKQKFHELQEKYETELEVLFFLGGFAFDALMVSEVDDPFAIIQQCVYLFVIASLIHFEILYRLHKWRPQGFWIKAWQYRNLLLHFLLGTLLNIYSIFYIKSASFVASLVFLALMIAMILANELPVIKKSKVSFKVGLFAICLFSYFSILYPLALGFVGWLPFGLAVVTTAAIFYLQYYLLKKKLPETNIVLRATVVPAVSVLVVFALFYTMGWIPPVPLSVKDQGIYHAVDRMDGKYYLSTEKVWWKFWQSGDQAFKAEPGDKIYFYAQIYSPARFSDQVYVHWLWKNPRMGWKSSDRIPLKIVGGRKQGYRGYAVKSNYQPGDWRVQVETALGQEISRMSFTVKDVPKNSNRFFRVIEK
jgi:hypothetical protein